MHMTETTLFSPTHLGALNLAHRVVMAPLTRMRALQPGDVPGPLSAEYYAQRATKGGLLIAEATQISPQGAGYPATPGIHTQAQALGWKLVTDAVHAKGGLIVLQLWHVGRTSHSSFHNGGLPVSASAIRPAGQTMTTSWQMADTETPRALALDELPGVIQSYVDATKNARAAGFDGVELHSANGYLLDQFLQDGSNKRTDAYGGPIENRVRLPLEVLDAIIGAWSADRVGIRLSPHGTFGDMFDSNADALFSHMIRETSKRNIAYLHLIEPRATLAGGSDATTTDAPDVVAAYRSLFAGKVIAAGGFTAQSAETEVATGRADAVAFGRLFISNPDLVERIRHHQELARYNRATFYGGAEVGYTDYPALQTA
jgi:N-ethylmaleimide reductase